MKHFYVNKTIYNLYFSYRQLKYFLQAFDKSSNNPPASCFLISLFFLLLGTLQLGENIILPLEVREDLVSVCVLNLRQNISLIHIVELLDIRL